MARQLVGGVLAGSLVPQAPRCAAEALAVLLAAVLGWALLAKAVPALYADYGEWARHEIGFAASAVAFGRDLAGRGFASIKIGDGRGFRRLRLRGELPLDGKAPF